MISRVGSLYEAIHQEVKIMLLKIISFLCTAFGLAFLYTGITIPENTGNFVSGPLFILIGVVLFVIPRISADKKTAAEHEAEREEAHREKPDAPSDSEEKTISFRVAGVSFDNDDGTSRQDILRHLHFGDAPYADDPEDLDVEFIETDYQGDPAIEVHINGYQVGHVPQEKVSAMLKAIASHADTVDSVRIIGGGRTEDGERISYGCEIEVSYI